MNDRNIFSKSFVGEDQFKQVYIFILLLKVCGLVKLNFYQWFLNYFEELTNLLIRNESANSKEITRILNITYCFLTVE